MSDNKTVVLCFAIVCFSVVVLIVALVGKDLENSRAAMENGYHQSTLPGQSGVYWVRP